LPCRLICVDPAQVHEFWPHVASLIRAAMEKGRLSSFTDVEHAVRNGNALLWLAWNGETVKAAAVTELTQANGETFCTIVACGGHDRAQWLPLLAELEAYGKAQGCAAMRIYGRRGWRKLLPEYRTTRVLLERELTRSSRVPGAAQHEVVRCRPGTVSDRDGPGSAMQRSAVASRCIASGTRERD